MSQPILPQAALLGLLALALAGPAAAQSSPQSPPAKRERSGSPLGGLGGSGKEPIKIDADRLDVFDRESKAVFAGNVVAVQGDSTIKCSTMTVHYQRREGAKGEAKGEKAGETAEAKAEPVAAPPPGDGAIRQVECAGPVTVTSKDQVATGDRAVFDRVANRVVLTGNVVLSQCQNVTRGSRLVYDMNSGRANMDPTAGGRVSAMFVPGGKDDAASGKAAGCAQPAHASGSPAKAAPKPRSAQAD
jgi:lipopolysaccharide export system protein LptA